MRTLFLSTVICFTLVLNGYAQVKEPQVSESENSIQSIVVQQGSDVSGEGQALLSLFKEDILPSEITLSSEPTITENVTGYKITVPQSVLNNEEKTIIPQYEVLLNRISDFNGYPAFEANFADLSQISPLLQQTMLQNGVKMQQFLYKVVFVPALNISVGQNLTIDKVEMQREGENILSVNQILEKVNITPLMQQKTKIERASGVSQFFLNTPLGALRFNRLTSLIEIPEVNLQTLNLQDLWTIKEMKFSSNISDLSISSMLLPVQEIKANVSLSSKAKKAADTDLIDVTTRGSVKDIRIAQNIPGMTEKLPNYITFDFVVPNIDGSKFQQLSALNQQLLDETLDDKKREEIQEKVNVLTDEVLRTLTLRIKEISLGSEDYSISISGDFSPNEETFDGAMTIVNFDFISPESQVDEKACSAAQQEAEAIMTKMADTQDTSLFNQALAAQQRATSLCEPQEGILEVLRPYLSSAKHSINAKGQTVDVFSLKYNKEGLYLNNILIIPNATKPENVAPLQETNSLEVENEPLIP